MAATETLSYDFDVVIIGGGPSGAIAAYNALRGGLSVLIIEKVTFPRVKPCAGGLTGRSLKWLPFSVAEVIEDHTDEIAVGYKYSNTKILKSPGTICAFVVREKLDDFVLNKALAAGAELDTSLKLTSIFESASGVEATFKCGKVIRSKYLVGADGVNSVTRKLIGEGAWLHRGYAIEGIVPKSSLSETFGLQFDFGIVDGGYGWIFPKGDHYNVGLYITSKDYSISRRELDDYVKQRLGADAIEHVVGFSLGFGGEKYKPKSKRIILVGDAAGFAEPFLGEGLHYAIKSGNIAGNALIAAEASTRKSLAKIYYRRLRGIRWDSWVMRKVAHAYVYPKLAELGARIEKSAANPPRSTPKKRSLSKVFLRGTVTGMPFIEILLKFPFYRSWKVKESPSVEEFKKGKLG